MPRFVFDVGEGSTLARDRVGIRLPSVGDVPDETLALLEQLGFDAASKLTSGLITVTVRNASDVIIYLGTVAVEVVPLDS